MDKRVTPQHPCPFLLVLTLIFVGYSCQPCSAQAIWLKLTPPLVLGEGRLIQTSVTLFSGHRFWWQDGHAGRIRSRSMRIHTLGASEKYASLFFLGGGGFRVFSGNGMRTHVAQGYGWRSRLSLFTLSQWSGVSLWRKCLVHQTGQNKLSLWCFHFSYELISPSNDLIQFQLVFLLLTTEIIFTEKVQTNFYGH